MILRRVLCQINRDFLSVHVSFFTIDHVQNQSVFLIAATNIYTCVCALLLVSYFHRSSLNHLEPLRDPIVPRCLNFQS